MLRRSPETKTKIAKPCALCGEPMDVFRTIPAAWTVPALLTWKCPRCGIFKTDEPPPGKQAR
jgi:hypothetical protein